MRLRKKEHHQDRGAIEAVEQAPGRIRQDGLVEQGVVGLESVRENALSLRTHIATGCIGPAADPVLAPGLLVTGRASG
jgi:hypothetical protein